MTQWRVLAIARRRNQMQEPYENGSCPDGTAADPETSLFRRWTPAQEANHREMAYICERLALRFQDKPFSVQEFNQAYEAEIHEPNSWDGGNKAVADEDE